MAEQQLLIPEESYITPLKEILSHAPSVPHPNSQENSKSIKGSLDALFPEQNHEDKTIQKVKAILGSLPAEFTHEQLRDISTEIQYLTNTWLDEFERTLFDGLTLNELLHEKGRS